MVYLIIKHMVLLLVVDMILFYQTHAILVKLVIHISQLGIISQLSHTLIINKVGQHLVEQQTVVNLTWFNMKCLKLLGDFKYDYYH